MRLILLTAKQGAGNLFFITDELMFDYVGCFLHKDLFTTKHCNNGVTTFFDELHKIWVNQEFIPVKPCDAEHKVVPRLSVVLRLSVIVEI